MIIGKVMNTIKLLILMAVAAVMMAGCTKNDDTTIVILGEEEYFNEIIKVIPSDLINEFDSRFGVQKGNLPPNVEGEFVMAPKKRVYSSLSKTVWPLDIQEPNVYLKFESQNNRIAKFKHYEEFITSVDTIYVMGKDVRFTAYYVEDKLFDYGIYEVKMKRGIIYSGRVTEDGIKYLKYANIIMDVQDDSHGVIETYPVGTFFIYEDGSNNGLAERKDWYNE